MPLGQGWCRTTVLCVLRDYLLTAGRPECKRLKRRKRKTTESKLTWASPCSASPLNTPPKTAGPWDAWTLGHGAHREDLVALAIPRLGGFHRRPGAESAVGLCSGQSARQIQCDQKLVKNPHKISNLLYFMVFLFTSSSCHSF